MSMICTHHEVMGRDGIIGPMLLTIGEGHVEEIRESRVAAESNQNQSLHKHV
jgi:hypothetical protein